MLIINMKNSIEQSINYYCYDIIIDMIQLIIFIAFDISSVILKFFRFEFTN